MIKIRSTGDRNIEEICEAHYQRINRTLILSIKRNTIAPLTEFLKEELPNIIKGLPSELIAVNQKYLNFCNENNIAHNGEDVKKSFSYPNFLARKAYNAYHLAEKLKVNVCPYCNRQYTFTVSSGDLRITRPQFDHFFSNTGFPLLALSFYNLVPSCYICNSNLKGDILFGLDTHFHPYLGAFGNDFKFIFHGRTPAAFEGLDENYEVDALIDQACTHRQRIESNLNVFALKDIYGHHKDQIREVVRKYHISGGKYLERLAEMFGLEKEDQEELYLLAFGNYYHSEHHELRPLAKFINDIYEDVFLDGDGSFTIPEET